MHVVLLDVLESVFLVELGGWSEEFANLALYFSVLGVVVDDFHLSLELRLVRVVVSLGPDLCGLDFLQSLSEVLFGCVEVSDSTI